MRSLAAPTSVFAAPEDWSDPALTKRIGRADTTTPSMDFNTDLMKLAAGGTTALAPA